MKTKKNSIEEIVRRDLDQLKRDRDYLIDILKNTHPNDKDLDFIVKTITTENAVIDELQSIVDKSEKES